MHQTSPWACRGAGSRFAQAVAQQRKPTCDDICIIVTGRGRQDPILSIIVENLARTAVAVSLMRRKRWYCSSKLQRWEHALGLDQTKKIITCASDGRPQLLNHASIKAGYLLTATVQSPNASKRCAQISNERSEFLNEFAGDHAACYNAQSHSEV